MTAKLTIELVPATCWFSNVRDHVSKNVWNELKKLVFKRAKYHCEICNGQGERWPVECHEVWNYDDQNHIQTLTNLIALCPLCHSVKHIGLAQVKGTLDIALIQLQKVNNWTEEKANSYFEYSINLWNERSKFNWVLELQFLNKYGIRYDTKRTNCE